MSDQLLQATVEHDAAYIQAQEQRIAELESERDHLRLAGLEVQSQRDRLEAENEQLRQALVPAAALLGAISDGFHGEVDDLHWYQISVDGAVILHAREALGDLAALAATKAMPTGRQAPEEASRDE